MICYSSAPLLAVTAYRPLLVWSGEGQEQHISAGEHILPVGLQQGLAI